MVCSGQDRSAVRWAHGALEVTGLQERIGAYREDAEFDPRPGWVGEVTNRGEGRRRRRRRGEGMGGGTYRESVRGWVDVGYR